MAPQQILIQCLICKKIMGSKNFEEIQHAHDQVCVIYKKQISQNSDLDNLRSAMEVDAITVLQKEVAA